MRCSGWSLPEVCLCEKLDADGKGGAELPGCYNGQDAATSYEHQHLAAEVRLGRHLKFQELIFPA